MGDEVKSGVHDVFLEKKIVPLPRGVWEGYKAMRLRFKSFQTKWYDNHPNEKRPLTLLDFPPTWSDLPTHYAKLEGKHLSKPKEWPRAGQDLGLECAGVNECFTFKSRGHLCKLHNPSTSSFKVVSVDKTEKNVRDLSVDNQVVLKRYLRL